MAFNQKELEIIQFGLQNNKSKEDVKKAIARLRADSVIKAVKPIQPKSKLQDFVGDITETYLGVGETLYETGQNVFSHYQRSQTGQRNPVAAGLDIGGSLAGGVGQAVGDVVIGTGKAILSQEQEDRVKESVMGTIQSITEQPGVRAMIDKYESLDENAKQNLRTTGNTSMALVDILTLGTGSKLLKPIGRGVEAGFTRTGQTIQKATDSTTGLIKQTVKKTGDVIPTKKKPSIAERISPEVTRKEGRKIIKEGRAEKGKESFLFGKRPDKVIPTQTVSESAKLIEKQIPGASVMDDFQLTNAIDNLTTSKATALRAVFKEVPVTPKEIKQIRKEWDILKKQQLKNPDYAAELTTVKSTQRKFDDVVEKIKQAVKDTGGKFRKKNLDDIWEVRKQYDDSVSPNVKNASYLSTPSQQTQKELWLENRRILNELLEQMSKGLDEESATAFREMQLLYEARNNLINKTRIDVKGKEGLINKKNVGRAAIGGTAAGFLIP